MILLSGAAGFIGRVLRQHLVTAGCEVLALKRGSSFTRSGGEITLDLTEPAHYAELLDHCGDCAALIHLAGKVAIEFAPAAEASAAPRAVAHRFADLYEGNVVMTARLLEFARTANIPHILFASSQTVYGLPAQASVTEDCPLAPLEYYAASKVTCETMLALWSRAHDRKATVLRFPGIWAETRPSGFVRTLCQQALEQRRIRAGADYPVPVDVLHAEDLVSAFASALRRPGDGWRAYNVSTGEFCSLTRLAADIAELVPGCLLETFGVAQPDILLDPSRAAAELGWRARPRRERLVRFIDYLNSAAHHA